MILKTLICIACDTEGSDLYYLFCRLLQMHPELNWPTLLFKKRKLNKSYAMIPDKEFKFYLASILMLFVFIYATQAIMLYRLVHVGASLHLFNFCNFLDRNFVMLGTFLAGLLFYTVFLLLYSLHICRVCSDDVGFPALSFLYNDHRIETQKLKTLW